MTQTIATSPFPANDVFANASGNIAMLTGENAVEAACLSASLLRLNEAILATTLGIPFFQAVFNGVPNVAVFENYLRTAILAVQGVTGITSLTVSVSQGALSYVAEINSIYGELEIASPEILI